MSDVSVIIPTHNRDVSIVKRSLDSVLNQSIPPKEIIVVDSGIVEENSLRIERMVMDLFENGVNCNYIRVDDDSNGAHNRNVGALHSSGKWLCFLDDDDEWYPNKLSSQLSCTVNDTGIICSDYDVEIEDQLIPFFSLYNTGGNMKKRIIGENCIGCTSMVMISADIFNRVGGFDEKMASNQEWDLWIKASKITNIIQNKDSVGIKHYSELSISNNKQLRIKGWARLLRKHSLDYLRQPRQFIKASFYFFRELVS